MVDDHPQGGRMTDDRPQGGERLMAALRGGTMCKANVELNGYGQPERDSLVLTLLQELRLSPGW